MTHASGEELPIDSPVDEAKEAAEQYPNPPDKNGFVHLHTHTLFSPLDGVSTPDELFAKCAEYGMPAIAITDHGLTAAAPDAYFASKKSGIKYIFGNEMYYCDFHPEMREMEGKGWKASELMHAKSAAIAFKELGRIPDYDKEQADADFVTHTVNMIKYQRYRRNRHITVLAKNKIGYKNLIHLSSNSWLAGDVFYGRPRIWLDKLDKHREGLIILSGCLNGPVSHEVREEKRLLELKDNLIGWPDEKTTAIQRWADIAGKRAVGYVQKFREIFGDDYYIELQMPGPLVDKQMETFEFLANITRTHGIKGCITNDAHYIDRKSFTLQKIMMAIAQGVTLNETDEEGKPKLFHVNSDQQFLKTRQQLRKTFIEGGYVEVATLDEFEQFCDNTLEVAAKCDPFTPDLTPKLPEFPNAPEDLREKTFKALKARGLANSDKLYEIDGRMVTHKQQCEIELERFIEKGFASYFLITQELVNHSVNALGKNIGPGRGSAAGSLVCFLLGIHSLDPLKWKLSFDRFLSPSRGGNMLKVEM